MPQPAGPRWSTGRGHAIKFDISKLSHPDKIVGGASVVLFISLFLSWFSYNTGFGIVKASGLSVHGYLYIPLLISVAIIAMMGATALGLWTYPATSPVPRERALLIGTTIERGAGGHRVLVQAGWRGQWRRAGRSAPSSAWRRPSWPCFRWPGRPWPPAAASRPNGGSPTAGSPRPWRLNGSSPHRGRAPASRLARRWRRVSHS